MRKKSFTRNRAVCKMLADFRSNGEKISSEKSRNKFMSSAERQRQAVTSREIINETLPSLSLPKRILTSLALASRSAPTAVENLVSRFVIKELYLYDLMKKASSLGLSPKVKFGADQSRLSIVFDDGYLRNTIVNLRRDGSDLHVFSQILLEREYEPLVELIKKKERLENIRFIVDAGANVGLTTVYLKKFFPPAAVISIEPDAANFRVLTENVRVNRLSAVNLLNAGLWQKETRLEIDRNFRDHLEWSVTLQEKSESEASARAVQGISLAALKKKFDFPRIDILKIDIEGGERFLFADEATAAQTLESVRYLALEIHDEFGIRPQIEDFLKKNGFSFFEVAETVFAHRN